MSLAVVTVAYGAPELLAAALAPLRGLPCMVVDNSSSPAVAAVTAAAQAHYLDPGRNLGFATGVNLAATTISEHVGQSDLLVLNPDAVLSRDGAERLYAVLLGDESLAAVAPRLENEDGSAQRSTWPWPTPAGIWREALGLGRFNDRRSDWLVGAVLLLRAKAWVDVGQFDERFFLYQEETDWQRRAALLGWKVRLVDDVCARHLGAGTSVDSARREALFHAGTETYVRKWFGPAGWRTYRSGALTGALARSCLAGERGASGRSRLKLYWAGPRVAAGLDPPR